MDENKSSDFRLIRILPRSRAPLPRMTDLRDQMENLPDSDEEDSLDEEGDYLDEEEDCDDDVVDASPRMDKYNRSSLGYESVDSYHTPKTYTTYTTDPKKKSGPRKPETKPVGRTARTERHIFCWVVAVGIPVFIAFVFKIHNSNADGSNNETELYQSKLNSIKNLEENINSISQTFNKQSPEIWSDFIAGIADVINDPKKPAIFILFANQDDTMLCLAKMIANASKVALGSDNNLWLSASDMGNDYGTVIDRFKDKIKEQKVVIVDNLLNIDSKAMLAFHHLCDKENPLVKEAVYIITMVAEGYSKEQRPIQFIEDQLIHKMKDTVNKDKLHPLIMRITDGPIIPIQPEPDIRSCPLRY